ncbi:MAG: hypothetical protein ACRELW_14705 [Candidatus Rokuibacteriota bacterium]
MGNAPCRKATPRQEARAPGPAPRGERAMSIFYIIGVVVVVLFFLGYLGLR